MLYEALLQSLFASCRGIGLCLYDRKRMPLDVINGALVTHPIVGSNGHYRSNPFYDSETIDTAAVPDADVLTRLDQLERTRSRRRKSI